MESLFKTLKIERIHRLRDHTRAPAELAIVDSFEGFDNHRHMHASIGSTTPARVESTPIDA